ncbi:MAG: hypothetical protein IH946_07915, partial [Bacteroidetes bacterium]|nr:hypothetical protein [Bacteroidota bacterium]
MAIVIMLQKLSWVRTIKYDNGGKLLWKKVITSVTGFERTALVMDSSLNIFVTGVCKDSLDLYYRLAIFQYNKNGVLIDSSSESLEPYSWIYPTDLYVDEDRTAITWISGGES